mgnify:CR=1 FL=1
MRPAVLLLALALVGCAPAGPDKAEQQRIIQQIAKASDDGGWDGKVAGMALENGDRAMGCHYGRRSIASVEEIKRLAAKLTPESRARLTNIDGLIAQQPKVIEAIASICPAP